jgi:cysteine desulfurase
VQNIFLDHNSTTPLDKLAFQEMIPFLEQNFGNPSSVHGFGRAARVKIDESRGIIAQTLGIHPREFVFTSGGTESDNFAILGVALSRQSVGKHIITCQIEHPAVLNPCKALEEQGFSIDYLSVDSRGVLDLERLKDAIKDDTILISIQHANSEIGTIHDIEKIGHIAKEKGILFHTDAVQTFGKLPLNLEKMPVDLASVSAHKLCGPKGIGGLFIRRGTPPLFQIVNGGNQEFKRRGGTENVAGIAGFGKAAELACSELEKKANHMSQLKKRLIQHVNEKLDKFEIFGDLEKQLPNTVNLGFKGVRGEDLLIALDIAGFAVSTGSACSSGSQLPSHVLSSIKVAPELVDSSIRISLGRNSTTEEIDKFGIKLLELVNEMRANSRKGVN